MAVGVVIGVVFGKSPNGGNDPRTWAWIDVVCFVLCLSLKAIISLDILT